MTFLPWPLSVPVLTDGEVTLRAHVNDDIVPLVEMVTDAQTRSWTEVPLEYHERAAEQFVADVVTPGWETGSNRIWVIEVGGRFVGQVDLRGEGPVKEIAYALHPAARGNGYTRAAVRLVLDYAFSELSTEVVRWCARVGNVPSLSVAHACGFTFHGTVPQFLFEQGQLHDAWFGSIRFGEPTFETQPWIKSRIDGERVRLRPLGRRDLDRWDEAMADAASRHYLVSVSQMFSEPTAMQRWYEVQWAAANATACTWVITDQTSDEFQGVIVVDRISKPEDTLAELEWVLHPEARGKGLMREAVELAVKHTLSPGGFNQRRVSAYVAAENGPSNRVAVAARGRLFGTQTRSEPLGDGSWDDLNEYEWLR